MVLLWNHTRGSPLDPRYGVCGGVGGVEVEVLHKLIIFHLKHLERGGAARGRRGVDHTCRFPGPNECESGTPGTASAAALSRPDESIKG